MKRANPEPFTKHDLILHVLQSLISVVERWPKGKRRAVLAVARLDGDGSTDLPRIALKAVADPSGAPAPLAFDPIGNGSYRVSTLPPAGAKPPRRLTAIPVVGPSGWRLQLPPEVVAGLRAHPGDVLVYRQPGKGSIEVRTIALLTDETARALGELFVAEDLLAQAGGPQAAEGAAPRAMRTPASTRRRRA